MPFPGPITNNTRPITTPSAATPDDIFEFLTHLIAMNGYSAAKEETDKPKAESIPESDPGSPAPTVKLSLSVSHKSLPA